MKKKEFEKDPMWTCNKQEIADFRKVELDSIKRYLATPEKRKSLILGKDEEGTIWFCKKKPEGIRRGRPPKSETAGVTTSEKNKWNRKIKKIYLCE